MIRILLVDDQKSIRERLKSLLETEIDFEIVGMVDNGYDAIEQVKLLVPDVVLMDMEMPDIDGILATKFIAQSSPKTRVLVLSSYDGDEYVTTSIYSGANGYILKGAPASEIRDAIRFVNRGYIQIAPGLFEKFVPQNTTMATSQRFDFPPGLELTGINSFPDEELDEELDADFDRSSHLVSPAIALQSQKTNGWYRVSAMVIVGLGLIASFYFLRQNRQQSPTVPNQTQQSRWLNVWSVA